MGKDVSILILSWNTRDYLRECLASIPGATGGLDCETIVIDNASSDGSSEMVEREFPWVHLVRNPENVGYAQGNNQAYAISHGDFILLLNSDVVLPPNAVAEMLATLRSNPSIGMVVPRYVYPDGSLQREMYGHEPLLGYWVRNWTNARRIAPRWLLGEDPQPVDLSQAGAIELGATACALVYRPVIERLGGLFDERFPLFCNDADLCRRIRDAGLTVLYSPDIQVVHHRSRSVRQATEPWQVHALPSAMRYCAKHQGIGHGALLWLALTGDVLLLLGSLLRSKLTGRPTSKDFAVELRWRCEVLFPVPWHGRGRRRPVLAGRPDGTSPT